MKIRILRVFAAVLLLSFALPSVAQNVRYEQQGTAYVTAEDQWIADRLVDQAIGAPQGADAQVVFYRTHDQVPGPVRVDGGAGPLALLESGTCVALRLVPGSHAFVIDGRTVTVRVEPGERDYVRITSAPTGPKVAISNALTFLRLVTGKRDPLYASN
ncbi:hypothetical protein [Thermomonas sp.]|uniref:hypothetical protein n=1 Tax=Thermomonas sp. TaxID=1971895 RepID=UPI002637925E|nr:hypothetical protein [Thermomonas sp.]MCO5054896.1 hypothetical protein [Thermomonas sp.]